MVASLQLLGINSMYHPIRSLACFAAIFAPDLLRRLCSDAARRQGRAGGSQPRRQAIRAGGTSEACPTCRRSRRGGTFSSGRSSPTATSKPPISTGRRRWPASRRWPTYPNTNLAPSFSYMFSGGRMKSWDRHDGQRRLRPDGEPVVPDEGGGGRQGGAGAGRAAGQRFEAQKFDLQRKVLTA